MGSQFACTMYPSEKWARSGFVVLPILESNSSVLPDSDHEKTGALNSLGGSSSTSHGMVWEARFGPRERIGAFHR